MLTIQELLDICENDEFDMNWNSTDGIAFREYVKKNIQYKSFPITENKEYIDKEKVKQIVKTSTRSEALREINDLPIYTSTSYEHRYADSTMESMTKNQLIEQIHCLTNNNDALQDRINNQANYLQDLCSTLSCYEDIETAKDKLNEELNKPHFFFSFGSNDKFPYQDGYIVIYAENEEEAINTFKQYCPNRPGSDCINCSFIYPLEEWENIPKKYKGTKYATIKDDTLTGQKPDLSYLREREDSERG